MPLTDTTDVATAIEALRSRRAAASSVLDDLESLAQYEPLLVCLVEWAGPTFDAYQRDVAPLVARLNGVRGEVRDAVDDLWAAMGEADHD